MGTSTEQRTPSRLHIHNLLLNQLLRNGEEVLNPLAYKQVAGQPIIYWVPSTGCTEKQVVFGGGRPGAADPRSH